MSLDDRRPADRHGSIMGHAVVAGPADVDEALFAAWLREAEALRARRAGGYVNALSPVIAWPRISVWISLVPS